MSNKNDSDLSDSEEEIVKVAPKKPVKYPAKKVARPKKYDSDSDEDARPRRGREIDYNDAIIKLTKLECTHHFSYSHYATNKICNQIFEQIVNCYDDGKVLTQATFNEFLNYITTKTRGYYYQDTSKYKCIYKNPEVLSNALMVIFSKGCIPNGDIVKELVKIPDYDKCYQILNQNPDFKGLTDDLLEVIVNSRLKYSCDSGVNQDADFATFVINNTNLNVKNLLLLCGCRSSHLAILTAGIIDKLNDTITDDFMNVACEVLPYSKPIIHSLINRGIKLNSEHLEIVCSNCDSESIEFFLQITRMPIAREHYKALVKSQIYAKQSEEEDDRYYYRNKTKKSNFVNGYTEEKMELLIKYGYKPDYDDVLFGVKNKVSIPNVERFDIKLDKKILETCYDVDYYPKYNFDFIDKELIALQESCASRRLAEVKSKIKKHNLTPDRKCMENACKFANNATVYDHLKTHGGKTTFKCIKNCASLLKNNRFLTIIIDDYEKNFLDEMKQHEDKIKRLEDQIIKLGGTLQTAQNAQTAQTAQTAPKPVIHNNGEDDKIDYDPNEKPNITGKKLKVPLKVPKNIEIVDDDDDNDNVDVDEEPNDDDIDDIDDEPNVIDIPIDATKVNELQKQYRLKSIPSNKLVEILKIDDAKKLSYIDIKRYLMDKIKTDMWFDKNYKNLIKLPDNIKEKLNLDKDGLVDFKDIDKLICLLLVE